MSPQKPLIVILASTNKQITENVEGTKMAFYKSCKFYINFLTRNKGF